MLSEEEINRYSRHLLLPEIGKAGQEKLKSSRVLVIGAGGLGCPVLMYLAAAGVGTIGIIDFDRVDITNLQRQVLFDIYDVGKQKAEVAKNKLTRQNPNIRVNCINDKLRTANALELFSAYDIIVDGTDNFSTRYLVNDACVLTGKPLVSGSIFKFQGQISIFNLKNEKGIFGPTYRCLFPTPPPPESAPSCSAIGVLGVLPGMIGTLMANEVIKLIVNIGEVLSGKILLMDALSMNFHTIEIESNPESRKVISSEEEFRKMNYDHFCGVQNEPSEGVKEITALELQEMLESKENIQLLDVRELYEIPNLPELTDLRIPLGAIEDQVSKISRFKKVVVICQSGIRSRTAIALLSEEHGFDNLINLKGGLMEWMSLSHKKQKHERKEKT